jgi:hypothetical protein
VNVFTALLGAHLVGKADVVIVAMGPGGVGTGTRLGYSGVEQAQVLDATGALGGRAVGCVRISFSDARDRHQGISHHSLTSLALTARPATIAVPRLTGPQADVVNGQLGSIDDRHQIVTAEGGPGLELLRSRNVPVGSMGRSLEEAPEPFLAAAAAGAVAGEMIRG